ncbi:MAG: carboxymuconolactone decarboxylase family protein [Chitinophagales bacterium]|nr:carboxymuconolactone decarboxylase family protein [Chitinophagales bacterium]
METLFKTATTSELLELVGQPAVSDAIALEILDAADHRYLRDLKINLQNALRSDYLGEKEMALTAVGIATNLGKPALLKSLQEQAIAKGANEAEVAEAIACGSLLAANNVLYRFRHFAGKEKYEQLPARIKMNIMANPVMGKELFELISTAVSALNGCERCVKAHEESLLALGATEEKIFDVVRLAAVLNSLAKVL